VSGRDPATLRVALLTPRYYPEVQRGTERTVRDLAAALAGSGHKPRVITSHPGAPSSGEEDGFLVVRHWRPPEAWLLRRGFQEHMTHVPFSYASLLTGDDDLAQAFYLTDMLAAVGWARRTGRPAVFHYGGLPTRPVLAARRLRLRILRQALDGADAVVVYSRAAADGMRRWFGIDPHVINAGVRLDEFRPRGERAPEPAIAYAAAPEDSRKRVDLLLRALPLVRRDRPGVRLLLPRPGDPRTASRLEETDGVELFEPGPDAVAPVFRRAWVSVLPSYNEAFGIVLVESLACGTPVVATRDGALPEIVDRPDVGRLFEGGEAELAGALLETLELSEDPGTAAACRARAGDFSTERSAAEHLRLYRELLVARA